MRYNPPPNWPQPPSGWTPPPGWQPDPSWPPAPPGWQLWEQPQRPWVARHKVVTGVVAFVLVLTVASAFGGKDKSKPPSASAATTKPVTSDSPAAPASPQTLTPITVRPTPKKVTPTLSPTQAVKASIVRQDGSDTLTSLKLLPAPAGRYSVHAVVACHETLIDSPVQAIYEAAEQAIYASYHQKTVKVTNVVVSVTYPTNDAYGKTHQTKMITESLAAADGYKLNFALDTLGYASVAWAALWHQTYSDSLMANTAPER